MTSIMISTSDHDRRHASVMFRHESVINDLAVTRVAVHDPDVTKS